MDGASSGASSSEDESLDEVESSPDDGSEDEEDIERVPSESLPLSVTFSLRSASAIEASDSLEGSLVVG